MTPSRRLNRLAGHVRRTARRSHRGAPQNTAGAGGADQGAAAPDGRPEQTSRFQRHRHPAGQRHPGRPGQEPAKLGADDRALADVGPEFGTAIAARVVFPFTQNSSTERPRRLLQPACRFRPDNSTAQADTLLGTHWGQWTCPLPPAPGDPYRMNYTSIHCITPEATVGRSQCAAVPGPPPCGPEPGPPLGRRCPLPDAGLVMRRPQRHRREVADKC